SKIVSRVLNKKMDIFLDYVDPDIPPMAFMEGIDLVTEGVLTLNRVVQLINRYAQSESVSELFFEELDRKNAASLVAKMLIETGTEVHLYVGKAINSAYQNPGLPFDLGVRQNLVLQLKQAIETLGKPVQVFYY
ncbi:MAG: serine/threonine-protein phosphatase, partial [Faecalibacterium sp.]